MSPAGTKKHMHAKSYIRTIARAQDQAPKDHEPWTRSLARTKSHMLRAKDPEPRTERQGPRAKDQERRTNSHSPRMKDHARAKNQEPWTRRNQIYHARTKYIYIYISGVMQGPRANHMYIPIPMHAGPRASKSLNTSTLLGQSEGHMIAAVF